MEYLPGKKTAAWAYNGSVPGPRLSARAGDRVIVHFRNSLPEPTTIHWHGLRIPAEMDGTTAMQNAIPPGGTFDYDFVVRDAGTFWYHPHVSSDGQVERGLYGAIVVRGDGEPNAAIERVMVLDDVFLEDDGTPAPDSAATVMLGRQGNVIIVNGRPTPTGAPGDELDLVTLPYERGEGTGALPAANVMRVRYSTDPALTADPLPESLREIDEPPAPARTREVVFSEDAMSGMPGMEEMDPVFKINGQAFPDVTPLESNLGDAEVWEVKNDAPMDHPFHLHGFFFQILSRDGMPEPYRAWKDTVNIPAKKTVRLSVALDGFPGTWAYHCHILEHAERGMAGLLNVAQ